MKILITGENGYVGKSFEKWIKNQSKNIEIDFVSIRNDDYLKKDYSKFSIIIHLAALVHIKEKSFQLSDYLSVNLDKTKEIINKAIDSKVEQFIFMSTMAVFSKCQRINENTPINPITKYGISKKMAEDFLISKKNHIKISIIRSPMIYGREAPGNARLIENISSFIPFFPSFKNKRSFIEINELNKSIFQIIESKTSGIFHPSSPLMSTFDLFKYYRGSKKTYNLFIFNPIIYLIRNLPFFNKVFGDLYYDFISNLERF
jgi:UDP-glucose 4-epimerase